MTIYILNVLSIPIWYTLLRQILTYNKAQKYALLLGSLQIILIVGLRDVTIGVDTRTYEEIFRLSNNLDWWEIFSFYIEPGFVLINKIVEAIFHSFNWVLLICAIISVVGISEFIKEVSLDFQFSLFLFVTIGYMSSMMNVMRQYVALTIVLFAFLHYRNTQKIIKPCILLIIAATIHASAIVNILVLLVYHFAFSNRKPVSKLIKTLIIGGAIVAVPFGSRIISWVFNTYFADISTNAGFHTSFVSMSLLVKVVCSVLYYFNCKAEIYDDDEIKTLRFLNYLNLISCYLSIMAGFVSILSRFNIYYSIITIVFIPNIFIKMKNYRIFRFAMGSVFLLMYIRDLSLTPSITPWIMGTF